MFTVNRALSWLFLSQMPASPALTTHINTLSNLVISTRSHDFSFCQSKRNHQHPQGWKFILLSTFFPGKEKGICWSWLQHCKEIKLALSFHLIKSTWMVIITRSCLWTDCLTQSRSGQPFIAGDSSLSPSPHPPHKNEILDACLITTTYEIVIWSNSFK